MSETAIKENKITVKEKSTTEKVETPRISIKDFKERTESEYTKSNLWTFILRSSLPVLFLYLSVAVVMITDSVMAQSFLSGASYGITDGAAQMISINAMLESMNLINMSFTFIVVVNIGAALKYTNLISKGELEKGKELVGSTFVSSVIMAMIALGVMDCIGAASFASGANAGDVENKMSLQYILISTLWFLPYTLNDFVLRLLTVERKARFTIVSSVIMIGTNIFFDWLFMGVAKMGFSGAALGSVLAIFVSLASTLCYYTYLHLSGKIISWVKIHHFKANFKFAIVCMIGGSAIFFWMALMNADNILYGVFHEGLNNVSNQPPLVADGSPLDALLNAQVGDSIPIPDPSGTPTVHTITDADITKINNLSEAAYGEAYLGAKAIYEEMFGVTTAVALGFMTGIGPLISYNVALKKPERVKKATLISIFYAVLIGFALNALLMGLMQSGLMEFLGVPNLALASPITDVTLPRPFISVPLPYPISGIDSINGITKMLAILNIRVLLVIVTTVMLGFFSNMKKFKEAFTIILFSQVMFFIFVPSMTYGTDTWWVGLLGMGLSQFVTFIYMSFELKKGLGKVDDEVMNPPAPSKLALKLQQMTEI